MVSIERGRVCQYVRAVYSVLDPYISSGDMHVDIHSYIFRHLSSYLCPMAKENMRLERVLCVRQA